MRRQRRPSRACPGFSGAQRKSSATTVACQGPLLHARRTAADARTTLRVRRRRARSCSQTSASTAPSTRRPSRRHAALSGTHRPRSAARCSYSRPNVTRSARQRCTTCLTANGSARAPSLSFGVARRRASRARRRRASWRIGTTGLTCVAARRVDTCSQWSPCLRAPPTWMTTTTRMRMWMRWVLPRTPTAARVPTATRVPATARARKSSPLPRTHGAVVGGARCASSLRSCRSTRPTRRPSFTPTRPKRYVSSTPRCTRRSPRWRPGRRSSRTVQASSLGGCTSPCRHACTAIKTTRTTRPPRCH